MKLVVIAAARSRSTWLMNQLRTSPDLTVIDTYYGELVTPGDRRLTASKLGLQGVDTENWNMDFAYADVFWKQHPDGCFKLLAHGNGTNFYQHLMEMPDVYFVTIQRTDILNAIASRASCAIKMIYQDDPEAYTLPTRTRMISYLDNIGLLMPNSIDFKRAKALDFMYYQLLGKEDRWLQTFSEHERCIANVLDTDGLEEVERLTNSTFDWESLKPVSTYKEIFTDWEIYEKDARDYLGIT